MTVEEVKKDFIDALFNRGIWTKQVPSDPTEYRTRCPNCGDSKKSYNTGHLYIRVNPNDKAPILYNCFRCEEYSGVVTSEIASELEIEDVNLKSGLDWLNNHTDKSVLQTVQNAKLNRYDYCLPENVDMHKGHYMEYRLGIPFTREMLLECRIITSFQAFLQENHITDLMCEEWEARMLEEYYIGFLSYGNSHIIFRSLIDDARLYRWIKYPISQETKVNKCIYSMDSEIDLFTQDTITINMAEGILDVISARYNLGYNHENVIHMGVCGKGYKRILNHIATDIGVLGNNVRVNIFADNDAVFNKKANKPTDLRFFENTLRHTKHLFSDVYVYYNQKSKDIGVSKDKISLVKYRL